MPRACCVPNCKSNYYKGGYVASFAFPKDPCLREEWRKLIPRENLKVTDTTVVCEKHFHPSEVVKNDSVIRDDGSVLTVPRTRAKLLPGSVPTIFPDGRGVVRHSCDLERPKQCCVPGCNSNSDSTNEYVTVFKFPSDSHMKERWMKCIPRNNWSPTKSSVICRKHFLPRDMSLSTKFTDKKGVQREHTRKNPILKAGACPSVFLEVPSAVSTSVPQTHTNPEKLASKSISKEMISNNDVEKEAREDGNINEEVTGLVKVKQPGCSEGDNGRNITDEINSITSGYLNNSQIDDEKMKSPDSVQHTKLVRPNILLENLPEEIDIKERVTDKVSSNVKNTSQINNRESKTENIRNIKNTDNNEKVEHKSADDEAGKKVRLAKQIKLIENTRREESDEETTNEHKRNRRKKPIKTWQLRLKSRKQKLHDKRDSLKVSECQKLCVNDDGVRGDEKLMGDGELPTGEKSHKCDVCGAEFSHSSCLKVHGRVHTKEAKEVTYKCVVCSEVFTTDAELKVHKITHRPFIFGMCDTLSTVVSPWKAPTKTEIGDKPYKCDVCGGRFSRSSGLIIHKRTHTRIHTKEKPFLCDVCGVSFNTFEKLMVHRRIHTGEQPYKCDICSVGFSQSIDLKVHRRTHTGEKPYTCDVCGAGFSHSFNLQVHRIKHSDIKPYMCDVCGAVYTRAEDLKVHIRKHTGEKPYKCDICGVRFTTAGFLTIHIRTHTGEKPYMCDVCGTGFSRSTSLTIHKRMHTGEKPYKCDVCGVGFSISGNLARHKKTHTGVKPYKCDVCGGGFARSSALTVHRRVHTGEKLYKCDICGLGFSLAISLKKHKIAHTGEMAYKCDVCGVGFSQSGSLRMHKRIHPSEKFHKCDYCGVIFSKSGTLKLHIRIHTGERPYICDVCGVRFTRAGHLKAHGRIHTGEKPYKCDICGVGFAQSGDRTRHRRTHTREKP